MDLCRSLALIIALVGFASTSAGLIFAADTVDPTGTWTWVRELEGQEAQSVLSLSYREGKLTGSYKRQGQIVPISNAKLDKNEVSFEADGKWNDQKVHARFKGKIRADEIRGSIEIVVEDGSLPLPWMAKRGVDADDLAGIWKLKIAIPNAPTLEPELKLSIDGGSLKGAYNSPRLGKQEAKEVKLNGRELSWQVAVERDGQGFKASYQGKLNGHSIKGTLAVDSGGRSSTFDFTGERITGGTKSESKIAGGRPSTGPVQSLDREGLRR
jgi:hypothetical protein